MKNNLTLIVLGVTLVGLYYLVGNFKSDFELNNSLFGEKFLNEIESVELEKGSEKIQLSKSKRAEQLGLEKRIDPGQWLVTSPSIAYPSIDSLNRLLSLIAHLKALHSFESFSYSDFGLDSPQIFLKLSTPAESRTLKLGGTNPVSKRRYAMFDGEQKVFLLDEASVATLLKLGFSDLTPLKIPSDRVNQLIIEGETKKTFIRSGVVFESEQEKNLDPQLVEQYIQSLLSIPAVKSVKLETPPSTCDKKLTLDWVDVGGTHQHSTLKFCAVEGGNTLLVIPGAELGYEYGPEMGRLLDRKIVALFNRRLLSSITVDDFFASCSGSKFKEGCKVPSERIKNLQEQIQRVEVLDVERLPGRLMTPSKPECRLKLGSSKSSFEIGGTVSGDQAPDSPRFFISDSGPDHYRGVISGLVAKEFCQAVEKLCNEAKAACAG